MSEYETRQLRLIRKWIAVAESDFEACLALRGIPGNSFRQQIAFHAQQSVEKYIKSWLELKQIAYPYTHDISRLLDILEENGSVEIARTLDAAEMLTPYAVQFRYPFESGDLDEDDIKEAIRIASEVRGILRKLLADEVQQLYGAVEAEDVREAYDDLDLWHKA